jgi:MAF protein
VLPADVDESFTLGLRPEGQARRLAASKALAVAGPRPKAVVLAADTIVVYRGEMLGKPVDPQDARRMLQRLRGRMHRVVTGVALVVPGRARPIIRHQVTRVRIRRYSDTDIEGTIAAGVPFDKAGGYGIQDPILRPVQGHEGCFCNVMGLPLWTVARLLTQAGIEVSTSNMPERCASCPERTT